MSPLFPSPVPSHFFFVIGLVHLSVPPLPEEVGGNFLQNNLVSLQFELRLQVTHHNVRGLRERGRKREREGERERERGGEGEGGERKRERKR